MEVGGLPPFTGRPSLSCVVRNGNVPRASIEVEESGCWSPSSSALARPGSGAEPFGDVQSQYRAAPGAPLVGGYIYPDPYYPGQIGPMSPTQSSQSSQGVPYAYPDPAPYQNGLTTSPMWSSQSSLAATTMTPYGSTSTSPVSTPVLGSGTPQFFGFRRSDSDELGGPPPKRRGRPPKAAGATSSSSSSAAPAGKPVVTKTERASSNERDESPLVSQADAVNKEDDKKRKNAEAAQRCREKKKKATHVLEKEANGLKQQNDALNQELKTLRQEKDFFKMQLLDHSNCNDPLIDQRIRSWASQIQSNQNIQYAQTALADPYAAPNIAPTGQNGFRFPNPHHS